MRRALMVLFLSTLLFSSPRSAAADWLSLRDGGLLETKGPWQEKGKMVVYTSVTGPLLSVRASEVDLVMSRAIGKKLKKTAYVDLGVAADPSDPNEATAPVDDRGNEQKQRLQNFVQDPNAPRVSGSVSAQSNETAAANLASQMESAEEEMVRIDTDYCSRFDGTAAKNVCVMRAGIASELRKEEAARKAEADGETIEEPE